MHHSLHDEHNKLLISKYGLQMFDSFLRLGIYSCNDKIFCEEYEKKKRLRREETMTSKQIEEK